MDVFISWSGERSRAAAEALRGWLPKIINAIKPWLSSADIDKGARWSTDVASRLESAKAGIICLTPNNLHSDWILFEAGALSKTLQNTFVCPFLIGLEPSDVKPPLAQFQATKAAKDDVLKLLRTLNAALGEHALPDAHIEEAFEVWWPKLDLQLQNLPSEEAKVQSHRSEKDILEEILSLVRNQNRPTSGLSALANPPFHRSLKVKEAKELAERVDREIELRASLEKALKKKVLQVTPLDAEYYLVEAEGSLFLTLKVPEGIPTTEVAGQVLSQIEKQVNIPSKDSSK